MWVWGSSFISLCRTSQARSVWIGKVRRTIVSFSSLQRSFSFRFMSEPFMCQVSPLWVQFEVLCVCSWAGFPQQSSCTSWSRSISSSKKMPPPPFFTVGMELSSVTCYIFKNILSLFIIIMNHEDHEDVMDSWGIIIYSWRCNTGKKKQKQNRTCSLKIINCVLCPEHLLGAFWKILMWAQSEG